MRSTWSIERNRERGRIRRLNPLQNQAVSEYVNAINLIESCESLVVRAAREMVLSRCPSLLGRYAAIIVGRTVLAVSVT